MDDQTYATLRADLAKVGIAVPAPIQGGAAVSIAALLIPLIPILVSSITTIVTAIKQDPGGLPEDQSAALNAVEAALDKTNASVQALVIRTV